MKALRGIALLLWLALPSEGLAGGRPEWPRLVELEVITCVVGDVPAVRRMSPSLRERPEGEVLAMQREQPGLGIEGTLLRSRSIRFEDQVARSLAGWRDDEPQVRSLFLRASAATCQAFPAGTRHVFTTHGPPSAGAFTACDTAPAQELACALKPGSIASELTATALRLAPPDHLLALKAIRGPVLFDCAASGLPANTPRGARPLLGTRTRVVPIRRATVEPAPANLFDDTAYVRIALTIDRTEGAPACEALLCSRGVCLPEGARTPFGETGEEEVAFFVRREDAREVVSALEALR